MPRLCVFLDSDCRLESQTLSLSARESHHLAKVLRARKGNAVKVLNGKGDIYYTTVAQVDNRHTRLNIEKLEHYPKPVPELILVLAMPKGKTVDAILKGIVEIGIARVVPVHTDHVEGRPRSKLDKWEILLQGAAKQCQNPWLPAVDPVAPLSSALEALVQSGASGCVASLEPGAIPAFTHMQSLANHPPPSCFLAVGPEGDFSEREYQLFAGMELPAVSLGPHILRTETAALTGSALMAAAFHRNINFPPG